MEFTLEELEQEHTVLMGEAQTLLYTLEQFDTLQLQYASVGVCRSDVLSIEQLSGSGMDVNPNYFTEIPSQTNLNLAMEGLLEKMNAGVMALFGVVIAVIIAAFVWISKLFRGSDAASVSANSALAAAQEQLNAVMVQEALVKSKIAQAFDDGLLSSYQEKVVKPVEGILTPLVVAALDCASTALSSGGPLDQAKRDVSILRYLVDGVQYINPNDEIIKGMVYENFTEYLKSMAALIQPSIGTQESYNKQPSNFSGNRGIDFQAQPIRPILDLFAPANSSSKNVYAAGSPMSRKEYESIRKEAVSQLRLCNTPQAYSGMSASFKHNDKSYLLRPETYRDKKMFDEILARQAELGLRVYFDTKAAASRVDEIVKKLEETQKLVVRKRQAGEIPDRSRFEAFKTSLESVRADANLMSAYALFYDNFYRNQTKFFKTVYEGLKNVRRELEADLDAESSEELKRLIRESKKHPDELIERLKDLADR